MKKYIITVLMATAFLTATINASAVNGDGEPGVKASVSGKVLDKETGESLAGVLVHILGTDISVYTDLDGNFSIGNLTPGTYNIEVNFISYATHQVPELDLNPGETGDLKIEIVPN